MSGNGDPRDPHWGSTAFAFGVGILVFIIVFIALLVFFRMVDSGEKYDKVISRESDELNQLRAKHLEQLSGYRWIDPEKGTVGIPIERAMEIVAEEQKSRN